MLKGIKKHEDKEQDKTSNHKAPRSIKQIIYLRNWWQDIEIDWFYSVLCFRQQRVVVNGVKSDWAPVLPGVPRSTVLDLLLFSLYIHVNDISTYIESEIRLFLMTIFAIVKLRIKKAYWNLLRNTDRLGCWSSKWGMGFQPAKMQYNAANKKRDYKDPCFIYLGRNSP